MHHDFTADHNKMIQDSIINTFYEPTNVVRMLPDFISLFNSLHGDKKERKIIS